MSITKNLLAALVAVGSIGAWAVEYTTDTVLDADITDTVFKTGKDITLDLNGHAITITGAEFDNGGGAVITNSSATQATITLAHTGSWDQQLRGWTFSGNLVLHVKGRAEKSKDFQGVHNSHTGGTILDGFGAGAVDSPRFTTADAFGTGPLTLANGATIKLTTSEVLPAAFSQLIAGENDTDGACCLHLEKNFRFLGPIVVAQGRSLQIGVAAGATVYFPGDATGVRGRLVLSGNKNNIQFQHKEGLPNAAVVLKSETNVRWAGTFADLTDGMLPVGSLSTEAEAENANFINTTGAGRITLKVGNDQDASFYGNLKRDAQDAKDWSILKVGTGTWTLGRTNTYHGVTQIDEGAIRLAANATLGEGNRDVYFNGGALVYGADFNMDNAPASSNFKVGSTNTVLKLGAEAGKEVALTELGDGFTAVEKSGAGSIYVKTTASMTGFDVKAGTLGLNVLPDKSAVFTTEADGMLVPRVAAGAALVVSNGVALAQTDHIDLRGASMAFGNTTPNSTTSSDNFTVTNSDSGNLSTLTVGLNNQVRGLAKATLSGNLRLVVTGNNNVSHFPNADNKNEEGSVFVNTHTGGTVFKEVGNFRIHGSENMGSGPIVFAGNSSVSIPSSYLMNLTFPNAIVVEGEENKFKLEGWSWGPQFTFNGPVSGSGSLALSTGFKPTIQLNGDKSGFTGRLTLGCNSAEGTRSFWFNGQDADYDIGVPNGSVRFWDGIDTAQTNVRLYVKTKATDGMATVSFGNLTTGTDDVEACASMRLVNCTFYATTLYRIGSLGNDGVFAGRFVPERADAGISTGIQKVGAGKWTMKAVQDESLVVQVDEGLVVFPLAQAYTLGTKTLFATTAEERTFFSSEIDVSGIAVLAAQGERGGRVDLLTVEGRTDATAKALTLVGGTLFRNERGHWKLMKSYDETTQETKFYAAWVPNGFVAVVR